MPYYDTIEEDLKRAKEILAKATGTGCAEYRPDHNGECLNCDEWADAHDGGAAILGADIYAAYKLLESFVEMIEAMDPKVVKTVMRAQQISRRTDALVTLVRDTQECVCRTRSCGHRASQHHTGVCEVCNAGNCWC